MHQSNEMVLPKFTANGALCDRCGVEYTTRARWNGQGYEHICPVCMTPEERAAFALED